MHDLNTIRRLNAEAVRKSITTARNAGKHVAATYDGLNLSSTKAFDTRAEADSYCAAAGPAPGRRHVVHAPTPPDQVVGRRDQSEDRRPFNAPPGRFTGHNQPRKPMISITLQLTSIAAAAAALSKLDAETATPLPEIKPDPKPVRAKPAPTPPSADTAPTAAPAPAPAPAEAEFSYSTVRTKVLALLPTHGAEPLAKIAEANGYPSFKELGAKGTPAQWKAAYDALVEFEKSAEV